jgi:hypothetical protein
MATAGECRAIGDAVGAVTTDARRAVRTDGLEEGS